MNITHNHYNIQGNLAKLYIISSDCIALFRYQALACMRLRITSTRLYWILGYVQRYDLCKCCCSLILIYINMSFSTTLVYVTPFILKYELKAIKHMMFYGLWFFDVLFFVVHLSFNIYSLIYFYQPTKIHVAATKFYWCNICTCVEYLKELWS